ncbi:MAG: hypothetical protein HC914_08090 [Chloroflexaceae bacterium]|nr:hypothetical protein [Chloroflexaceae bacterium]
MMRRRMLGGVIAVAVVALLLVQAVQYVFAAPEFADEAFARVWNRQDRAVFEAVSDRSWTWGPENISEGLREAFEQGEDGERWCSITTRAAWKLTTRMATRTTVFL